MDSRRRILLVAFFQFLKCIDSTNFTTYIDACGGVIEKENGTITSPSFPHSYPPNEICIWDIKAPEHYRISVTFTHFDLDGNTKECGNAVVAIHGKIVDEKLKKYGVFCSSRFPHLVTSEDNFLRVIFSSGSSPILSDSVAKTGFRALFFSEKDECATNNGGCQHICKNTIGSYVCSCHEGFLLQAKLHSCKEKDECATDNGGCQHICKNTIRSYACSCREGFVLEENLHSCKDKDECTTNNGGCPHICKNTIGSYACFCRNGFVLHENLHDCKEVSCSQQITSPHGEIISPNYPDNYPIRKDCAWLFTTTPGHRIKLVFKDFELEQNQECTYDSIAAYDGDNDKSPPMGKFCGSRVPFPIMASGNRMYLVFKSDDSVQKKGFKATHTTICGGRLLAHQNIEHLYSHAKYGDQNYNNKADCDWIVHGLNDQRVKLRFLTFEVEHEQNCGYDYVEVYDGEDDSAKSFGKFCGNKVPPEFHSSGDSLMVRFRSDDTINTKGFLAAYAAIDSF